MIRHFVRAALFLAVVASSAHAASGNLTVFDDTDENGFNNAAANCSTGSIFGETQVVHSGTAAIAISKQQDNDGAGWTAPAIYSTSSDYDGVTFWVNSGNSQSSITSLAVFDASNTGHFLHLEDVYGAALPANTWIQFQIPFASPYFQVALSTPPDSVQAICVITHSPTGSAGDFLYLDDFSLRGADIFKNGFD